MKKRRDAGLALVAVLWGLAVLSLIAAAMLYAGTGSVRISRNAWAGTQAQAVADAGIQRAIVSLLDPRASHKWRIDGVAQDFNFYGADVRVTIQDESGMIDVNFASKSRLQDLLTAASAKAEDAATLADRIVDWRTPTNLRSLNGASVSDYRDAGLSYLPRNGPFQSVEEVNLVLGMTPELYARIAPALTVYSHRPDFDTRTAPLEVLLVIPGMDVQKARDLIAARAPPPSQTTNTPLAAGFDTAPVYPGHVFAIRSDVQSGRVHSSRDAVVQLTGDPARPFWILGWK